MLSNSGIPKGCDWSFTLSSASHANVFYHEMQIELFSFAKVRVLSMKKFTVQCLEHLSGNQ